MNDRIFYLAHPVAADNHATVQENLIHALACQKALHKLGILTTMPWYTWILIYGDGWSNPDVDMKAVMKMDTDLVVLQGGIILTGHKVSRGMGIELAAAEQNHCHVIDLVGFEPDDFEAALSITREPGTTIIRQQGHLQTESNT